VSSRDPAWEAWIDRARATSVERCAELAGFRPGRGLGRGHERAGPCPVCGGVDRFSINLPKRRWNCRKCGRGGRDGLGLLMHCLCIEFLEACEVATGEAPPRGDARFDEGARAARLAEIGAERARRDAAAAERERDYREEERARGRRLWLARAPFRGSASEAYLVARGIDIPPQGLRLGHVDDLPLYGRGLDPATGRPAVIHRGAAMLAPIVGADGRQLGTHRTWIDPAQPGAKVTITDAETGEDAPAKKVLGLVRGGHIDLVVPPEAPVRMIAGEGIETVLSAWTALARCGSRLLDGCLFRASVSLGNLAGRAADGDRQVHPTQTRTDSLGRVRKVKVPGDTPDLDDIAMSVPESVAELILLGDGDSDRFTTEMTLRRAMARHARPGRTARIAWADEGCDFNDMLRAGR